MKKRKLSVEGEIEILHDTIDSDAPQKMREAARDRLIVLQKQKLPATQPTGTRPTGSTSAPHPVGTNR